MTLDDAIEHAEEIASSSCSECANEHRLLAAYLRKAKEADELVFKLRKLNAEVSNLLTQYDYHTKIDHRDYIPSSY